LLPRRKTPADIVLDSLLEIKSPVGNISYE